MFGFLAGERIDARDEHGLIRSVPIEIARESGRGTPSIGAARQLSPAATARTASTMVRAHGAEPTFPRFISS